VGAGRARAAIFAVVKILIEKAQLIVLYPSKRDQLCFSFNNVAINQTQLVLPEHEPDKHLVISAEALVPRTSG
jgi:hypothetical protein